MRDLLMTICRFCLCVLLVASMSFPRTLGQPSQRSTGTLDMRQESFGRTPDGHEVTIYELTNANGLRAKVIDYGAILVSLDVPDRNGNLIDVALGFDDLDSYIKPNPLFGATVGRYANRIANAKFTLDGVE